MKNPPMYDRGLPILIDRGRRNDVRAARVESSGKLLPSQPPGVCRGTEAPRACGLAAALPATHSLSKEMSIVLGGPAHSRRRRRAEPLASLLVVNVTRWNQSWPQRLCWKWRHCNSVRTIVVD
jgi:hypothetical protein